MSVQEQFTLQPVMYTLGFLIRRQTEAVDRYYVSTFCYSISSFSTTYCTRVTCTAHKYMWYSENTHILYVINLWCHLKTTLLF